MRFSGPVGRSGRETDAPDQFRIARIITQRVDKRIDLEPLQPSKTEFRRAIQRRECSILVPQLRVYDANLVTRHFEAALLQLGEFCEGAIVTIRSRCQQCFTDDPRW